MTVSSRPTRPTAFAAVVESAPWEKSDWVGSNAFRIVISVVIIAAIIDVTAIVGDAIVYAGWG